MVCLPETFFNPCYEFVKLPDLGILFQKHLRSVIYAPAAEALPEMSLKAEEGIIPVFFEAIKSSNLIFEKLPVGPVFL